MFHHLKFESSQRELAVCKEEVCNCGDIFSEFEMSHQTGENRMAKEWGW